MFSFWKIEPMTKIKEIVKDSYTKKLESANEQKGSCFWRLVLHLEHDGVSFET